jgi:hypothetical protein
MLAGKDWKDFQSCYCYTLRFWWWEPLILRRGVRVAGSYTWDGVSCHSAQSVQKPHQKCSVSQCYQMLANFFWNPPCLFNDSVTLGSSIEYYIWFANFFDILVCMYFTQNDVIMSLISKPHSWSLLQNQSWTASNQSQGIQIVISSPRPGLEEPSGWDPWTNRRYQQPWERLLWGWKPGPEPGEKAPRRKHLVE